MKLNVVLSSQFKKDLKRVKKRGWNMNSLKMVVDKLSSGKTLEPVYHDHSLSGEYQNFRECHIEPDWLLVYRIHEDILELFLFRTGSHSDLFG